MFIALITKDSYFKSKNCTFSAVLRADSCNFRESGDTRGIPDFFIFSPNNLYGKLFSKIAFKGSAAFYFFSKLTKVGKSPFWRPITC